MLHDRPAMGFGLGDWARAYPRYAIFDNGTYVNQAHSDWLQWAVEGGVPFFLILLSLAAMAAPAALHSVWGVGLLSVWAHCLVEYPLQQRPAVCAWFFVLLGVLAASRSGRTRAPLSSHPGNPESSD
jgi:O-antigen ligase